MDLCSISLPATFTLLIDTLVSVLVNRFPAFANVIFKSNPNEIVQITIGKVSLNSSFQLFLPKVFMKSTFSNSQYK